MAEDVVAALARVRDRIEGALDRRGGGEVALVAVTKTFPAQLVERAKSAGIEDIGESRADELEEKAGLLGNDFVRWHFLGRLQRNKARRVAAVAHLIHSLDSLQLARKLSDQGDRLGAPVRCLLQVSPAEGDGKASFSAGEPLDLLAEVCEFPGLSVQGVMTMAPLTDDEAVLRRAFQAARRVYEEAGRIPGFTPRHLSMGMSNDFEIAVEEGSNMVRLGTVLFGTRER
ncbi:MAG: YggS family pyridoxal phosphate-dependent enzyme [Longimicrobiaceae bacterium]